MLQTTNHKRPRRNIAIIAKYSLSVGLLRFTRSAATRHIWPTVRNSCGGETEGRSRGLP